MFAKSMGYVLTALLVISVAAPGFGLEDGTKYTARLAASLDSADETLHPVWVRFADKGLTAAETVLALDALADGMSAKTKTRRAKGTLAGRVADEADLPVSPDYLAAVSATGASARQQSRWLNAASFDATAAQIEAIAALPFVTGIDLVGRGVDKRRESTDEAPAEVLEAMGDKSAEELPYGASKAALDQINVTGAHALGLSGAGVTIAMFDTGYELEHDCFQHLDVVATWDFINGDDYVGPRKKEDPWQAYYGTAALSVLAGYSSDNLVGPAYAASVILAKTEDISDETPAEEDNWIAALEWAEGLGVDVVSSGLGYYYWYSFADMDGQTALITVAAELAAARGVIVVNGVGDMGQNGEWLHILPPSDGRSVIAVGSVDYAGSVTITSSPGPTADGRIKPDIMALGSGIPIAYDEVPDMFLYAYGNNFGVPLVAGAVALMVEQNPNLTPTQAMEALRTTASRASLPDNNYGWGIMDAVAAMGFLAPSIEHTPLVDNEGGIGAYPVTAGIEAARGLDEGRTWVAWRVAGEAWQITPLAPVGGNLYTGFIPPQSRTGTEVEYYLVATDSTGMATNYPTLAPTEVFSFRVGTDTTPPTIQHVTLADQVQANWPPVIVAYAQDNAEVASIEMTFTPNPGGENGPFYLEKVGDRWELPFPVDPIYAVPGLEFNYMLIARDNAATPNFAFSGNRTFETVVNKGSILLVDDQSYNKGLDKSDAAPRGQVVPTDKSASDLAGWMTDAGFAVDIIDAAETSYADFHPYDAIFVSCASNFLPLNHPSLRQAMVAWAEEGGRILVEGGEVAYACGEQPGYPELLGPVLHIDGYFGEDGGKMYVPTDMADHPSLNRPHEITGPLLVDTSGGYDYGAADLVQAASTAMVATRVGYGTTRGGVILHDDNTGPDAGQTAFFPFNVQKLPEADGRELLDNILTYLLFNETPGTGSISGSVILAGENDHSGVTVRAGQNQSTVTAADGTFHLTGLWGGSYRVTAETEDFAVQTRTVAVTDDVETTGVEFYLLPVTELNYSAEPGLPIPDNNPEGITHEIVVSEAGKVQDLDIDVNISHFAVGHLTVSLTSPAGTTVTLHNRTGGTADDLVGNWPATLFVDGPGTLADFADESITGAWTLTVADHQLGALGVLNSWGLNLLATDGDVASTPEETALSTRLVGNAPNPFNPRTTISFDLAQSGPVRLEIFDVRGRLVRTVDNRVFSAGSHSVLWDGRDNQGGDTASGLYFFRMTTDSASETHKMLLVR